MSENEELSNPTDVDSTLDIVEDTMDRFLSAATVEAVFGLPIEHGENLIIPAAEVLSLAGFGVGFGSGTGEPSGEQQAASSGSGGGGGGGGRVFSRPVAVIVASPTYVRVKPVVDVTKIVMAWLTAFAFVFATMARMKRGQIDS